MGPVFVMQSDMLAFASISDCMIPIFPLSLRPSPLDVLLGPAFDGLKLFRFFKLSVPVKEDCRMESKDCGKGLGASLGRT
jgi:hypothetical protein